MQHEKPLEVRWHGRGGQGVVTASRILATTALEAGYYLQSLPDFGAERSGAPIAAYTRISDSPIIDRGPVDEPDVVIVLDSSLIGQVDMLTGLAPDGTVILNTANPDANEVTELPLGPDQQLWTLDASQIALDLLRRNLPNTPILGAFAHAVPLLRLETVLVALEKLMSETFPEAIVQANLKAVRRGHEESTRQGNAVPEVSGVTTNV